MLSASIDGDPRELTIDPANPLRMYYADLSFRRIYATENGGLTWGSLSSGFSAAMNGTLVIDNVSAQPRLLMGGNSGLFLLQRAPDSDLDGVPSAEEASAPNDGDGNIDFAPDNQQAHVASIGGLDRRGVVGASAYLTIEVTPITGTCNVVEDVRRFNESQLPYDAVVARSDALQFAVDDCTSATITVYGEAIQAGSGFGDVVRMFGPTVVGLIDSRDWRNASSPQFFAGRFSFTINDDVIGDADATVGRMQYTVRLGANALFGNGFE